MKIIKTITDMKELVKEFSKQELKIGYVPTMGYLHDGHIQLIKESKKDTDITIVSIFVNPAQFNQAEDLINYPKDIDGDIEKLKSEFVDILYLPELNDFYPKGIPKIKIQIPGMMDHLCGSTRPGHFDGVLLVLSKFFHIISPNKCYMGKKDYQQYKLVQKFCEICNFPIDIIGVETIRDQDGLALSSRNSRLNSRERESANLIPRSLKLGEKLYKEGERDLESLKEILSDMLKSSSLLTIDYLEIVDPETLEPKENLNSPFLIAVAVLVGKVRLIDNIFISSEKQEVQ
jgi:pantoate--beta-alanine ligase